MKVQEVASTQRDPTMDGYGYKLMANYFQSHHHPCEFAAVLNQGTVRRPQGQNHAVQILNGLLLERLVH